MACALEDRNSIYIPDMCHLLTREKPEEGEKTGSTADTAAVMETGSLVSGLTGGSGVPQDILAAASVIRWISPSAS